MSLAAEPGKKKEVPTAFIVHATISEARHIREKEDSKQSPSAI